MSQIPDEAPRRTPTFLTLQKMIHSWLVARFGLNDPADKDIWLYCIGSAMELERLAVGVLWIDDGRPTPLYEYKVTMSLGQAHYEIEKRGLLDTATRAVLKDVADLRNSVAHRHAIFVTAPSPIEGRSVGEYKGYQVFIYKEALDQLMHDVDAAARAMYDWMVKKAPDLAEEARRSGLDGNTSGTHPYAALTSPEKGRVRGSAKPSELPRGHQTVHTDCPGEHGAVRGLPAELEHVLVGLRCHDQAPD
jgi:hypothetical protein